MMMTEAEGAPASSSMDQTAWMHESVIIKVLDALDLRSR